MGAPGGSTRSTNAGGLNLSALARIVLDDLAAAHVLVRRITPPNRDDPLAFRYSKRLPGVVDRTPPRQLLRIAHLKRRCAPLKYYILVRLPTFTSTPALALVIQPRRFARELFLTTKKEAASRRRLSSLVKRLVDILLRLVNPRLVHLERRLRMRLSPQQPPKIGRGNAKLLGGRSDIDKSASQNLYDPVEIKSGHTGWNTRQIIFFGPSSCSSIANCRASIRLRCSFASKLARRSRPE